MLGEDFKIQDSRQLHYLIDEKLMTRFAVKMEQCYTEEQSKLSEWGRPTGEAKDPSADAAGERTL